MNGHADVYAECLRLAEKAESRGLDPIAVMLRKEMESLWLELSPTERREIEDRQMLQRRGGE